MAPTTTTTETLTTTESPPQPPTRTKLVCFSFAAYAKTLIDRLRSLNIPILPGLTDQEFSLVESTFHFTFPPDLHSILREGLPIGPHFPNWRSSSPQQLQILLNLPFLNLFKNVSKNNFWVDSWGVRPQDNDKALNSVKEIVGCYGDAFSDYNVPVLVPVYRNCYVAATCPNLAGNPVFHVDDKGVRVVSFDVARFFQEVDCLPVDGVCSVNINSNNNLGTNVLVWAAKEARRVDFWTEVAERGRRLEVGVPRGGWWWWWIEEEEFRGLLERVYWMLRDGGWKEDEVREMMMMNGIDDCDREAGVSDVRVMSQVLSHAGWSREDVVYSLGSDVDDDNVRDYDGDDYDDSFDEGNCEEGRSFLEFQALHGCSREGDDHPRGSSTITHLMNPQLVS